MTALPAPILRRIALATAGVAGAFMVTVAAILLYYHVTATTNDPWKSPQLLALKERLHASPNDTAAKEEIRALDLRFRQDYRKRQRLAVSGGWMLLGGAAAFVLALRTAAEAGKRLPQPQIDREAATRAARSARQARLAVAVVGAIAFAGMGAVVLLVRSHLDFGKPAGAGATTASVGGAAAPATETLPPPEEFARHWPRFLGPTGGSIGAGPAAPLRWDASAGTGVRWKVAVPTPGLNSPIVWGDRVFVSGATAEKREVFCYDARDGKLLWQCAIAAPKPGGRALSVNEMTGYAAPTMVTDGLRVYAIFAHGDLSAVTLDGKLAWTKALGTPDNMYGHASSLAIWQGKVIVQYDQGDGKGGSKLVLFDGATGRIVWEKPRQVGASWSTPNVFTAAGKTQIVTMAEPLVIAYDFANGAELWRAEVVHGELVSSPIYTAGVVLVMHPFTALIALKPDGSGDITSSGIAWKAEGNTPDVTTPVSDGELVFTVDSGGMLVTYDAKDGAKVWEQDLKLPVQATPVIVGRHLYVPCVEGVTVVIEIGREYREVARNQLGEKIYASPAIVGGRMYIRSVDHLFCVGGEEAKP